MNDDFIVIGGLLLYRFTKSKFGSQEAQPVLACTEERGIGESDVASIGTFIESV